MAITAEMVKQLRDKTGAGMMDCKAALAEANGDMDKAIEILRKKGARLRRQARRTRHQRTASSATTSTWVARSACWSR